MEAKSHGSLRPGHIFLGAAARGAAEPLEPDIMDNFDGNYFQGHGAHMTLMVFVQGPWRRRSPESCNRRAERARKRKADRKGGGTKGNGNRKGYGDPRVGKSGWKGSSAVAGKPASSSSASHKGYGGYTGNEQYSQAFDGDNWEASPQAQPSGMYVDPPNRVWHDKAKNQTSYHWGFDPSNQQHRDYPKRDPYKLTRPDYTPPNPWAEMGGI